MSKPLLHIIQRMITATGPLSIAEYMQLCHAHPKYGYYTTQKPIGAKGDFITAPEISQIFGELIGIWCIQAWQSIGKPKQIQIVELGPGNGTLMHDILRTIKNSPEFSKVCQVTLVEISPSLKKLQQKILSEFTRIIDHCETIESIPAIPTIFIANEFFDAIPFRQFIKTNQVENNNSWLENCVGMDQYQNLQFVATLPGISPENLPENHQNQPVGSVFEMAPAREALTNIIASHIATYGGAGLFIDYGHKNSGYGDTFQSVQQHQYVSPLNDPGKSDLTSHVDFGAISMAANIEGINALSLMSQGDFLLKMGLLERAGKLGAGKSPAQQSKIQKDVERLVGPKQMGELFKVLCLTKSGITLPPFQT